MPKRGIEYLQSDTKRRFDIVGSLAVSTMLLPAGALVGLACAIDTKHPNPFFTQDRVGGKLTESFTAFKFRTLPRTVNNMTEWRSFGTFDPRVSKLGQVIRQTGLDEIPQLANIILGNMALIGTRPLAVQDLERNQAAAPKIFDEWYQYFKLARPGLAGESQIYRHHYRESTPEIIANSMEMDLRYFESATLAQDIKWLGMTPIGMLKANTRVVENVSQTLSSAA